MNHKIACLCVGFIWIVSFLLGSIDVFKKYILFTFKKADSNEMDFGRSSSCGHYSVGNIWFEFFIMIMIFVSFIFLAICYGMIFRKAKLELTLSDFISPSSSSSNVSALDQSVRLSSARHSGTINTRKLVYTTIMFLGSFVIFWMPPVFYECLMMLSGAYLSQAPSDFGIHFEVTKMLNATMMIYPLADPIIYAIRLPSVRRYIFL